jgi:hypothetical protein
MHRGGYTGRKHSPQLDVSWYVFNNEHTGLTQRCCRPTVAMGHKGQALFYFGQGDAAFRRTFAEVVHAGRLLTREETIARGSSLTNCYRSPAV